MEREREKESRKELYFPFLWSITRRILTRERKEKQQQRTLHPPSPPPLPSWQAGSDEKI